MATPATYAPSQRAFSWGADQAHLVAPTQEPLVFAVQHTSLLLTVQHTWAGWQHLVPQQCSFELQQFALLQHVWPVWQHLSLPLGVVPQTV